MVQRCGRSRSGHLPALQTVLSHLPGKSVPAKASQMPFEAERFLTDLEALQHCGPRKPVILGRFHAGVADTLLQLLPASRLQRSLLLSCSAACPIVSSGPRHHEAPDDCTGLPGQGSGGERQALHAVHLVVVPTEGKVWLLLHYFLPSLFGEQS